MPDGMKNDRDWFALPAAEYYYSAIDWKLFPPRSETLAHSPDRLISAPNSKRSLLPVVPCGAFFLSPGQGNSHSFGYFAGALLQKLAEWYQGSPSPDPPDFGAFVLVPSAEQEAGEGVRLPGEGAVPNFALDRPGIRAKILG